MRRLIYLPLILLAACCNKQVCETPLLSDACSICIPYFDDDSDGLLTAAIIEKIAQTTHLRYVETGADLALTGEVLSRSDNKIGYQRDRSPKSGRIKNRLVANEGRLDLSVEITVTNRLTNQVVLGPVKVTVFSDYDYIDSDSIRDLEFTNSNGNQESVLDFSLGQLDAWETAQDGAAPLLYKKLATAIVAGLEGNL